MSNDVVLDALGDPTRRTLLGMIRDNARSVGELAAALPVSQPAVSQHLRILREAGLVQSVPEGRRRIYHVRVEGFEPLRLYLASFWGQALGAFQASFDPWQQGGK